MNKDSQLQLQAYLDSEVSASEARQIAAVLDRDPEAQALYRELRQTRALLVGNEAEHALPESHDFYWSKIRRAIDQLPEQQPAPASPGVRPWWTRLLVPLGAVGLLAFALFSLTPNDPGGLSALGSLQEIESPLEDTTAISFYSEQQKMTVVWVHSEEN